MGKGEIARNKQVLLCRLGNGSYYNFTRVHNVEITLYPSTHDYGFILRSVQSKISLHIRAV